MVATFPPTSNNADTSKQAAVLDAVDSTYSLLYFDSIGVAGPIRQLLALSGASWTQLYPQEWENEDGLDKSSTPFEVIPVLYVHAKDGSEVTTCLIVFFVDSLESYTFKHLISTVLTGVRQWRSLKARQLSSTLHKSSTFSARTRMSDP